MSVLIKDMEMPKNCDECPCYYETEGAWQNECQVLREERAISEGRPSWCPLVEIPPHGRLIDADAIVEEIIKNIKQYAHEADGGYYLAEDALESVQFAPTIIEAEEDE